MKVLGEYFSEILRLLKTVQVTDIIDIVLVTCLVYACIKMVRSTNSWRILKAVVLFLALFGITQILELHTTNFILSCVLELGLISLVILFQPELRRAVEKVGSASLREVLSPRERSKEVDRVIDETVRACEVMSRERIGALIVFERANRLDEYFKRGTIVDGRASEQLIRNIFFPKASLHDGAMIIRDGRVTAAGCVLPLSENAQLSADLGTRHRAGIGVSEVSDAVVVIVSEETGTISVAVGGMLKRHLAPQTLERLLINELNPDAEEKKRQTPAQWLRKITGKDERREK